MKKNKIAVLIPCYNEEENARPIYEAVRDELLKSCPAYDYEILFMDASDDTLIKRYKETRRAHPCEPQGRVEDGIRKEREILRQIKSKADYVFDTSRDI